MKRFLALVLALILALGFMVTALSKGGAAGEDTPLSDEDARMQKIHQEQSTSCFNKCWTIIDIKERSAEDVENMLLLAYTSLWHWKQRTDCQPVNLSVGYWLVSRVHSLAGQYEMAHLFGEKCLRIAKDNKLSPFYLGYAYEALARAEIVNRSSKAATKYLAEAREQLAGVEDEEEKNLLNTDIEELQKSIANKPGTGARK